MIFPRRLLLMIAAIAVSIAACNTRRPARFLIPDGFKGWVRLSFQVPNTKPLPVEDGRWLFNLDSAGHLQTSSPLDGGVAADDFYYVSTGRRTQLYKTESCGGGSIWGVSMGSDTNSNRADREWFFVGSEAEYRQQIDPGGRIYIPCLDTAAAQDDKIEELLWKSGHSLPRKVNHKDAAFAPARLRPSPHDRRWKSPRRP